MSVETILALLVILLACGCAGLWFVRLSNPRLLGLGWLGGSFAAGGLGSILLLLHGRVSPLLSVLAADLLVLLSFVLLHFAVSGLVGAPVRPAFGRILLLVQAATDLLRMHDLTSGRVRVVMAGLLIAAQLGQTAWMLPRRLSAALRLPGMFCATLLVVLLLANLVRSVALAVGLLDSPAIFLEIEAATYTLYLAVALGIAFSFFWMTTTMLSANLEEMASTDPLTRTYNRRIFLGWCEKEWQRAQRNDTCFSLLMLDLDHFKQINDQFGHHAGDDVLCAAVEKMQDAVRGIDVLGRWGGEEFVVLLPNASRDAAFLVAQRIRGNVEKARVWVSVARSEDGKEAVGVTVSVGIGSYQGPGDTIDRMLRRADAALFEAKARGRNRVFRDDCAAAEELSLCQPAPSRT